MKKVKLHSMTLRNFKGVKEFTLVADGNNTEVFGDNAAGKTTLFDGFMWVLFDKDSQNKKDFAIKTLTAAGKEINNMEHAAEVILKVGNETISFKKVFRENWTRKRGQSEKTFEGHKTDHFVDDVPMSKKAFTEKVEAIVKEDVFKLLTSPTYFNENVKWQDRRSILLEICGDISDEEVISSNQDLAKLNDILSGKSLEDMKKIIASKRKHINDELEKIPVRIDEIHNMTPSTEIDVAGLNAEVANIESEIDALKTQKANVTNGAAVLNKRKQLQEIELQMNDFERNFKNDSMEEVYKLQARLQECEGNLQIVQQKLQHAQGQEQHFKRDADRIQQDIERLQNEMNDLRGEYANVNAKQFEFEDKCECPTCKQSLPVEQVESARNEALAQFNESKSQQLANIQQQGKSRAARVDELKLQSDKAWEEVGSGQLGVESLTAEVAAKTKDFEKAKTNLETAKNNVPDVTSAPEYQSLVAKKQTIQTDIQQLQEHANEAIFGLDAEISELTVKRQSLNAELAQFANIEANHKRIAELEEKQAQLADEFENLERNNFLIEEFTRTKVNMLNDRINAKFQFARFKLFDVQVNGALNEVCETLYEGVPYGAGLNNAARINVGLDIINTLSEHYGITAPIFIDNAEAVTKFIDTNAQMVSLIVSEQDKQLRVEIAPIELKEAI